MDFSRQQRTENALIVDGQTLEVVKSAKILVVTLIEMTLNGMNMWMISQRKLQNDYIF